MSKRKTKVRSLAARLADARMTTGQKAMARQTVQKQAELVGVQRDEVDRLTFNIERRTGVPQRPVQADEALAYEAIDRKFAEGIGEPQHTITESVERRPVTHRTPLVYEAMEEQLKQLRFFSDAAKVKSFLALDYLPLFDTLVTQAQREEAQKLAMTRASAIGYMMTNTLEVAEPFFVSADIVDMLVDSLDSLPTSITLSHTDLPVPTGFVLLEKPVALQLTPSGLEMPLSAFSFASSNRAFDGLPNIGQSMVFNLMGSIGQPDHYVLDAGQEQSYAARFDVPEIQHWGYTHWFEGATLENTIKDVTEPQTAVVIGATLESEHERLRKTMTFIGALIHFMNQRFVSLGHHRSPRAVNRRWEHERKVEEAPTVRVIQLRAREPQGGGETGTGSKWKVRSIRRSHWHNYWCGGGSAECLSPGHDDKQLEARFLMATVCGPADAPLKRSTDIFAVVR